MQEEHDVVDALLLQPRLTDLLAAFPADAFHVFEFQGLVFDHVEDARTKFLHHALRIRRADTVDQTTAQIALDALAAVRAGELERVGFELIPVIARGLPFTRSLKLRNNHSLALIVPIIY